jgi:hypothetical protein
VAPASVVLGLDIWIVKGPMMSMHLKKICADCFAVLCQLCSVERSLTFESVAILFVAVVLMQLYYCNATGVICLFDQRSFIVNGHG